jgi:hypothetical protein
VPDTVSLREYLEAILSEREKRNQQRFDSQLQAVKEAETTINGRLALLNELRGDVATKGQLQAAEQRIQDIVSRLDKLDGHGSGTAAVWARLVSLAVVVSATVAIVVNLFFRK